MSACTISLPRRTDAGYCYRDDAGLNVCLLSVSVSVTTVIPLKRTNRSRRRWDVDS